MKHIVLLVSLLLSFEIFSMERPNRTPAQSLNYVGELSKPSELSYLEDPTASFSNALFGNVYSNVFQNLPITDNVIQYLKGFKNANGLRIFDIIISQKNPYAISYFIEKLPFLNFSSGRPVWYQHQKEIFTAIGEMRIRSKLLNLALRNPYLIKMRDQTGRNILQWAIDFDLRKLAYELIEKKPELIRLEDENGWTALDWAVFRGDVLILQKIERQLGTSDFESLLRRDFNGGSILHWLVMSVAAGYVNNDLIHVADLLRNRTLDPIDDASEKVSILINWLKERGTKLNLINNNALHVAIMTGDQLGAERLIRYFPSLLNEKSKISTLKHLYLPNGLVATHRFQEGETPLEYARNCPAPEAFRNFIAQAQRLPNHEKKPVLTSLSHKLQMSFAQDLDLSDVLNLDDVLFSSIVDEIMSQQSITQPTVKPATITQEHKQPRSPIVPMDVDEETKTTFTEELVNLNDDKTQSYLEYNPKRVITGSIPNALVSEEYHGFKTPKPNDTRTRSYAFTPRIFFENVVVNPDQKVLVRDIDTGEMRGKYFTLHENFPNASERVTLILAGRKTRAYIPKEEEGGRIVLILAGKAEMKLAQSLVAPHVDVFVCMSLNYFSGQKLQSFELPFVTSRRIAAFELIKAFPKRKTIAVLDDNIRDIVVSDKIIERAPFAKNWRDFYETFQEITADYDCIGFKEFRPDQHQAYANTDDELHITKQGDNPLEVNYGQKIFFFNAESIRKAANETMRNLFPPEIRLTQEDLYFQIFLAKAHFKVGHVRPNSMYFHREKKVGNLYKGIVAKSPDRWSEQWIKVIQPKDSHVIAKETTEEIKKYVSVKLKEKLAKREKQLNAPLVGRRITEDLDEISSSAHDEFADFALEIEASLQREDALEPPRKKQKTSRETVDLKTSSFSFANSPAPNFLPLEISLQRDHKNKRLRDYQKDAIKNLGNHIANGNRIGFIEMPTGTGKTRVFTEAIYRARKAVQGNIAIILPNLEIEDQIYDYAARFQLDMAQNYPTKDLKHFNKIISVSSRQFDNNAHYASFNRSLIGGGYLVIFCERSFAKFVEHRRGNLDDFSMLIFDEMHLLQKNTVAYLEKLQETKNGLILGFSATPRKRKDVFGGQRGQIYQFAIKDAVDQGVIVPWETRLIEVADTSENFGDDLAKILLEEELDNAKLKDMQGIVWTNYSKQEVRDIAEVLRREGIKAEAYYSHIDDRKGILNRFKKAETKVLIAIRTLREGFDSNVDYVVIHQSGEQSQKQFNAIRDRIVQMRGRALRKTRPNKTALIIATNAAVAEFASADGTYKTSMVRTTTTTTSAK